MGKKKKNSLDLNNIDDFIGSKYHLKLVWEYT